MNPVTLCQKIRDNPAFERTIIGLILVAAVVVGLETYPSILEDYGGLLKGIDQVILWGFVLEAVIKIVASFPRPWRYFMNGWNLFDFTIVVICFLPAGSSFIAVLRLARILRVFRMITVIPRLQMLVLGILKSIPSLFYVSILMLILFYIYAVLGVFLFRGNDPGHFGDLQLALTTLFRVVTLEDWTDVMYTAFYGSDVYFAQGPIPTGAEPKAFGFGGVLFFVSFVIVGAMVMINLFIGVVLTSLSEAQTEQLREKLKSKNEDGEDTNALIHKGLERIELELKDIRSRLPRD